MADEDSFSALTVVNKADNVAFAHGGTEEPSLSSGLPVVINESRQYENNSYVLDLEDEVDFYDTNTKIVGGVKFDKHSEIDEFTKISSRKVAPRLAFVDSDEQIDDSGLSETFSGSTSSLPTFGKQQRSVSESVITNVSPNNLHVFTNPASRYIGEQQQLASQHSSDSDLITDHSTVPAHLQLRTSNSVDVQEEDFGQFLDNHRHHISTEGNPLNEDCHWHCHNHRLKIPPDKMARNQLIAVSVLCFLFMIGEAIGGALSNSLALFTDVLHLGSDLISFLVSILSMYLAKKQATRHMTFGYHRAEVLGALVSVFIIWSVTGVLIYMAIERIIHEHYKDVKPDEMLITACLGVIFNIVMGIILHSELCCKNGAVSFGHGHSHGGGGHSHGSHPSDNHTDNRSESHHIEVDSHRPLLRDSNDHLPLLTNGINSVDRHNSIEEPDKPHPKNINVRAAFIHVIGDIIQSFGVLLASIIIKLKPEEKYRLADPICTFLFSVLVLFTTINVLKDTLRIIMEAVPQDTDYYSVKTALQKIPGVKAVHGLTIWCLTLEKNAMAVHIAVDPDMDHQKVLVNAYNMLSHYNFIHTTIQVEDYNSNLSVKCSNCQELKK